MTVPPHAVDSERFLVANLMCPAVQVAPLEPVYFYHRGYRLLSGAIWVLTEDGTSCTERSIINLLLAANRFSYDAQLALHACRRTPYTSRRELAEHRARIVDAYHRRQVMKLLGELRARAESGDNLADLRKMLTQADVWGTT